MEAATSWLIDQEHVLQREEDMENQATPLQQTTQPLAAFSTHSAGVAGILRREEQLAATTDRHGLCSCFILISEKHSFVCLNYSIDTKKRAAWL